MQLEELLSAIAAELNRHTAINEKLAAAKASVESLERKRQSDREQLGSAQARAELEGRSDRVFLDKMRRMFRDERDELELLDTKVQAFERELLASNAELLRLEDLIPSAKHQYLDEFLKEQESSTYNEAVTHIVEAARKSLALANALGINRLHGLRDLRIPHLSNSAKFFQVVDTKFVSGEHVVVLPVTDDPVAEQFGPLVHRLQVTTRDVRDELAKRKQREEQNERQKRIDALPAHSFADSGSGR